MPIADVLCTHATYILVVNRYLIIFNTVISHNSIMNWVPHNHLHFTNEGIHSPSLSDLPKVSQPLNGPKVS